METRKVAIVYTQTPTVLLPDVIGCISELGIILSITLVQ